MPSKAENEQWETVAEARNRIVFDADGDVWEGYFEGGQTVHDDAKDEDYEYLNFRDEAGDGYMVSKSYQLGKATDELPVGTYVRITRTGTTVTRNGTMTNFKVQARR